MRRVEVRTSERVIWWGRTPYLMSLCYSESDARRFGRPEKHTVVQTTIVETFSCERCDDTGEVAARPFADHTDPAAETVPCPACPAGAA